MNHCRKASSHSVMANIMFVAALGCISPIMTAPAIASERAVAGEKNPPGDIPDSQVFITFKSPAGFSLSVPEGWARTAHTSGARFADKFNTVDIDIAAAAASPSAMSVKSGQAVDLVKIGRAVKIATIKNVQLPAGPAVLIVYESNSEPNRVTNKRLRLESNRYLLYRNGQLATLDMAAPLGADNVDQWKLIARSFRWN